MMFGLKAINEAMKAISERNSCYSLLLANLSNEKSFKLVCVSKRTLATNTGTFYDTVAMI